MRDLWLQEDNNNLEQKMKQKLEQKPELKMIKLSDVQSQEIEWLWYPFIPYGKLTMDYLMKHWNGIIQNRREKTEELMIIMKKLHQENRRSRFTK